MSQLDENFKKIPCYFSCYQGSWPRFVLVGDNIKCVENVNVSDFWHFLVS
jgi:hypothetical protein